MNHYLFFLGRFSDLCSAELDIVLRRIAPDATLRSIKEDVVLVTSTEALDVQVCMLQLGGTVKIAQVFFQEETTLSKKLSEKIAPFLMEQQTKTTGKVTFSCWIPNDADTSAQIAFGLKEAIKTYGRSSRFVEGKIYGITAAQQKHESLTEICLVQDGTSVLAAKTISIQDVDAWSMRDFEKPYRDAKKGMLPPKIARIMANLAIGTHDPKTQVVYDPFCGSGTILMEAALLGASVIGSDTDKDAIYGTGKNLQWLDEKNGTQTKRELAVLDATQLGGKQFQQMPTCIATEPFLGKPNPDPKRIDDIAKGLEKLYLGMLKRWADVLPNTARIVVIFPQFQTPNRVKNMQRIIDRLGSLGYTRENGPFLYTRPYTVVQREIFVLTKLKKG